jgi:hypothetical protein
MGHAPSSVRKIAGYFTEKDYGQHFEYVEVAKDDWLLAPLAHGGANVRYPHKVFVGPLSETRYAFVKGSVAHVVVDETAIDGSPMYVVEKWHIKNHRKLPH